MSESSLNITERVRTNPFPWKGQFSPQLAEQLLHHYAPKGSVVLDPFVGSGTSLIEASRLGHTAQGYDLNPAAVILARVYQMITLNADLRAATLTKLHNRLCALVRPTIGPLFSTAPHDPAYRRELECTLVKLWQDSSPGVPRDLTAALIVLCDFHQKSLGCTTVLKTWRRLDKVVRSMPISEKSITVQHADARALPSESNSIDLVLTSPPYINVHNYHQKYRRSVEAMGWNVLDNARAEIGANRQNRGNRFLTVIQYSLDMALALREMNRVAKPGARLILVLGRESTVRGTPFFNGELVTEIAVQSVGLGIERRQERVFRNRYGADIYEDIIHFISTDSTLDERLSLNAARRIAHRTLSGSRCLTPLSERSGIDEAIDRIETVSPSPILTTRQPSRR